jgi:hypothetical protein
MIGNLDFIPKSIAPAMIAYLIVCYGLGDLFAERLARTVYIPACVRGEVGAAARATYGEDLQKEIGRQLLDQFLNTAPSLRQLPAVRAIEQLSRSPVRRNETATANTKCTCLAGAARSAAKWDHMAWVASIRLHVPEGVANFPGVMARLDQRQVCGKGGRS